MYSNYTQDKDGKNSLITSNSLWQNAYLLWMILFTLLVVLVTKKPNKLFQMLQQANLIPQQIKLFQLKKLLCRCQEHLLDVFTVHKRMKFMLLAVTTRVNFQKNAKDTQLQRTSGIGCQILMSSNAVCLWCFWMMESIFTQLVGLARWILLFNLILPLKGLI